MITRFDGVRLAYPNVKEHLRNIAIVINRTLQGKLNCTNEVTLVVTAEADIDPDIPATTTVNDPLMSSQTTILFDPLTESAAQELSGGTLFVAETDRTTGSFVITHTAATTTDRKFRYLLIG